MLPKKRIPLDEAIIKIRTFCVYRDRCHKEVRDKLYSLGLWKKEVDQAIILMIDEDLLNEERYARSYARGYFRTKQWGKMKIKSALFEKQVHNRLIEKALTEIDEEEYKATIKSLCMKKLDSFKEGSKREREQKTIAYLQRKGYSYSDIAPILKDVLSQG